MGKRRSLMSWLVAAALMAGAVVAPSVAGASEGSRRHASVEIGGPIFSALGALLQRSPTKMLAPSIVISISGQEQPDAQFACTVVNGDPVLVEEPAADVIVTWKDQGPHTFAGSLVTLGVCTQDEDGETFEGLVEGLFDGAEAVASFTWSIPAAGAPSGTFSVGTLSYLDNDWEGCAKVVVEDGAPTCGASGGGGGSPTTTDGRMTGGGKIEGKSVAYNITLDCDPAQSVQTMKVTWDGNQFDLTSISDSTCSDEDGYDEGTPEAGFDTFAGEGSGQLNGQSGVTITWKLTDRGEPAVNDTAAFTITSNGTTVVLDAAEARLDTGNNQAHKGKAAKSSTAAGPSFTASGLNKAYVF